MREDESLPSTDLYEADCLELGVDHNGQPTWYIATREGWEEAGDLESVGELTLCPRDFPVGCRIQLSVPKP